MRVPLQASFARDRRGGLNLHLYHAPCVEPVRGAAVYVHPFAEEMNKSRRMAAIASRALADRGWAVLQVDLQGCGDSSGDFGEARWAHWVDDVCDAHAWLARRHPGATAWLWGLRAGALLAAEAAQRMGCGHDLLLWQPAQSGRSVLQQFLRLKAASALADGGGKALLEAARRELAAGHPVEVAGYTLHPGLASGLEAATLAPPIGYTGRVVWLELSSAAEPALSPAAQRALAAWREQGWRVDATAVAGPAFWQTTEIEDAPALVDATVAALCAGPAAA